MRRSESHSLEESGEYNGSFEHHMSQVQPACQYGLFVRRSASHYMSGLPYGTPEETAKAFAETPDETYCCPVSFTGC